MSAKLSGNFRWIFVHRLMGEETIYETTPAPKIMRPKWESTTTTHSEICLQIVLFCQLIFVYMININISAERVDRCSWHKNPPGWMARGGQSSCIALRNSAWNLSSICRNSGDSGGCWNDRIDESDVYSMFIQWQAMGSTCYVTIREFFSTRLLRSVGCGLCIFDASS